MYTLSEIAAIKAELDSLASEQDRDCPRASALRDRLAVAPWEEKLSEARGWAYATCCEAINSGSDLSEARVVELSDLADLPEGK